MIDRLSDDLAQVYALENVTAARADIFAALADRDGRTEAVRLFRALASSSRVRARRLLMLLRGKAGSTDDNLAATVTQTADQAAAYDRALDLARSAEQTILTASLNQLGTAARSAAEWAADIPDSGETVHVCQICGQVLVGDRPDRCPVCGAVNEKMVPVD